MARTSNHDYGSFLVVAYDGTHRGVVDAFTEESEAKLVAATLHKEAQRLGVGTTYVVQTKQGLEDTPYQVKRPQPEVKVDRSKEIGTAEAVARVSGLEESFKEAKGVKS